MSQYCASSIRQVVIIATIFGLIHACGKSSPQDDVKRVEAKRLYTDDSICVFYWYNEAVAASENNVISSLICSNFPAEFVRKLHQHAAQYPLLADKFNGLLRTLSKWPIRMSSGTVYIDTSSGVIVRESIQHSRWVTYEDYLTDRFPDLHLDTLIASWRSIHSNALDVDIAVPSFYSVIKSETDSTLSLQLAFVDTSQQRRHVPYIDDHIDLTITRSLLSFDVVAKTHGITLDEEASDENNFRYVTHLNGDEVGCIDHPDSSGIHLGFYDGLWDRPHTWLADSIIRFSSNRLSNSVTLYAYGKERLITSGGLQLLFDIIESVRTSPRK